MANDVNLQNERKLKELHGAYVDTKAAQYDLSVSHMLEEILKYYVHIRVLIGVVQHVFYSLGHRKFRIQKGEVTDWYVGLQYVWVALPNNKNTWKSRFENSGSQRSPGPRNVELRLSFEPNPSFYNPELILFPKIRRTTV